MERSPASEQPHVPGLPESQTLNGVIWQDGRPFDGVVSLLAISSALFALYTGLFGEEVELIQRSVHLAFSIAIIFLITSTSAGLAGKAFALFGGAVGLTSGVYIVVEYSEILERQGQLTEFETLFGVLIIVFVLEASRRIIGWALPLVALICIAYAYLGPHLPFGMGHRGYDVERITSHLFLSTDGIYGTPLGVSATFIFMFVLFGAFLEASGAGVFLTNMALALTGRSHGGPAKVAVVSSAFFGTMSGSAIANASATGTFTIPLMRRVGYKPHVAASFESLASLGGQLMPPIMGAAAFVMVELTGLQYLDIASAALIPGLLFFFSVFLVVDFEASRNGLKGLPASELPRLGQTLKDGWILFVPIGTLFTLLYLGFSTFLAAFWSIPTIVAVAMLRKSTRINLAQALFALRKGGVSVTGIAAACACSGIIVGIATMTGLAVEISNMMISFADGNLFLLLLLTMVASIILGMGLPTVACYILLAVLVAPALEQLGLSLIGAHLFIFYFGIVSGITPPVALVSYAAAGVANTDAVKTSWSACRLGVSIYILPFAFIFVPELLLDGDIISILAHVSLAFGAFYLFSAAIQGFLFKLLNPVMRLALCACGVCMLFPQPEVFTPAAAAALAMVAWLRHGRRGVDAR